MADEFQSKVAEALRKARKTAQLSQSEASLLAGVPQGRLSEYENAHRTPQVQTFMSLAKAYGTTVSSIIGETPPPPESEVQAKAQQLADKINSRRPNG